MGNETCLSCGFRGGLHHALCEKLEKRQLTPKEREAQRHIGYLEGLLREHGIEHRQIHGMKVTYSRCEKHGLYVRTDENVCPACWRGE